MNKSPLETYLSKEERLSKYPEVLVGTWTRAYWRGKNCGRQECYTSLTNGYKEEDHGIRRRNYYQSR